MGLKHTRMTSRQFNQEPSAAKRAAQEGPVFITDRGEPAHVLLTYAEYQKLTQGPLRIGDLLSSPETADIDFELTRSRETSRPLDLD